MDSLVIALVISSAACGAWFGLLFRMAVSYLSADEHRPVIFTMPIVGLIASVGTLFSAIGYGISSGSIDIAVSRDFISLVASLGRGALLMGGVIGLGYYHPPKHH